MKHLGRQPDPASVNHTICPVFNEEKTRKPLVAWGRAPLRQRPWRRLDGDVKIVTQLRSEDLGLGGHLTEVLGLSVALKSQELCEKSSEVSRPPLASCRSLCPTAIALLLVILVRSLRHQGWRDLRWLDRGALLHGDHKSDH